MSFSKIKTLLLYAQYSTSLSYYDDWKDAFTSSEYFEVKEINICDLNNVDVVRKSIRNYDFIVILHSAIGDSLEFIIPYGEVLRLRVCKLLSFVANEVNLPLPSSMRLKIDFLDKIKAEFIATQLPRDAGIWLYEDCKAAKVVAVPHALNPSVFKPVIPQKNRKIDIGVRSHKYMPYLGDNERNELFDFFINFRFSPPLQIDLNLKDRFNRTNWADFLNSAKGTLSNEAGSYYLEKDDKTVNEISAYVTKNFNNTNPNLKVVNEKSIMFKMRALAPRSWREWYKKFFGYANTSELPDFMSKEINELFFKNYPKPKIYTKAISSRHFDAIGTKTLQIMFPGKYNDILVEDVHYLSLKKDFSNINEVVEKFRDTEFREKMTTVAFEYVMLHHTYRNRMDQIKSVYTS